MSIDTDRFVCLARLADQYVTVHRRNQLNYFLAAETNLDTAKTISLIFAEVLQVPLKNELMVFDRPIYTVIQSNQDWYPAELHPDRVRVLTDIEGATLGSREKAIEIANRLAVAQKADFIPQLIGADGYLKIPSKL